MDTYLRLFSYECKALTMILKNCLNIFLRCCRIFNVRSSAQLTGSQFFVSFKGLDTESGTLRGRIVVEMGGGVLLAELVFEPTSDSKTSVLSTSPHMRK